MKNNCPKSLNFIIFLFASLGLILGLFIANKYWDTQSRTVVTSNITCSKVSKTSSYSKFYYKGLVSVIESDPSIVIDLRYGSTNNFTGQKLYAKSICLLQENTLKKLIAANKEFKTYGYKIKIWDAYRPQHIQLKLWDLIKDRRFIASPYLNWSRHNRGTAVDITLVDMNGNELEMPTGFDEFSTTAYRSNTNISATAKENVELLTDVMTKHGFSTIETEWWHYDDSNADSYPLIDLYFENIS